jgi:arylsulfatase A-like enzyme
MGFDEYLSHDNFFEMNPPLSRNGAAPAIVQGEGSAVVVEAAAEFTRRAVADGRPFFVAIHFGSPHDPHSGTPDDVAPYAYVSAEMSRRFAELTAMDRAIGTYRALLQTLGVRERTLLWFNSDNGISWENMPEDQRRYLYNGPWRGTKNTIYEGGLRVPAIVEWPEVIRAPRQSDVPVVTSDFLPTLLDITGVPHPDSKRPLDGISVKRLLVDGSMTERPTPIGFWRYAPDDEKRNARWLSEDESRGTTPTTRNPAVLFENYRHPVAKTDDFGGEAAWTDMRYKLIVFPGGAGRPGEVVELYDLLADPRESRNLAPTSPDIVRRMQSQLREWQRSVERSLSGADYAGGEIR